MIIKLKIAQKSEIKEVQCFFNRYLLKWNSWIVNEEFLCPFWIEGAINRGQVTILKYEGNIIGALRFYTRKKDNITSIYQFALDERFRWKWLIKKLLKKTWVKYFESTCFVNSSFNDYYKKTGWKLEKTDEKFNYWNLVI
jgi:hypothetical protein